MAVQVHLQSRLFRSNSTETGEQVATDRTCAAPLVKRFLRMTPSATGSRCSCKLVLLPSFEDYSSLRECADYRRVQALGAQKANGLPQCNGMRHLGLKHMVTSSVLYAVRT